MVYILKWFIKYLFKKKTFIWNYKQYIIWNKTTVLLTEKVEENKNKEKYEEYYKL